MKPFNSLLVLIGKSIINNVKWLLKPKRDREVASII
jgi:hypothetical protein